MRLIEKCKCGGSIELIWSEPSSPYRQHEQMRESERAKSEVTTFRKAHKVCRESNQDSEPKA